MLIETPIKLNDVVTIKMVGGDEVIGKLIDERTEDYIELSKPLVVMMSQQGFGLAPFILTAGPDCTAKIDRRHVVTVVKTLKEVASQYIKQTTGLIT
jgi:hypothetical protein